MDLCGPKQGLMKISNKIERMIRFQRFFKARAKNLAIISSHVNHWNIWPLVCQPCLRSGPARITVYVGCTQVRVLRMRTRDMRSKCQAFCYRCCSIIIVYAGSYFETLRRNRSEASELILNHLIPKKFSKTDQDWPHMLSKEWKWWGLFPIINKTPPKHRWQKKPLNKLH